MVDMVNLEVTVREIPRVEIPNKQLRYQKKYLNLVFLRVNILLIVAQNPKIHTSSERAKQDALSDALKCFAQTVTDFCCHQQKTQE